MAHFICILKEGEKENFTESNAEQITQDEITLKINSQKNNSNDLTAKNNVETVAEYRTKKLLMDKTHATLYTPEI